MQDDMFFSPDMKSMRRGKRIARRTETCRPCLVWFGDDPDTKYCGVVMDITAYGMRIRMLELLPMSSSVFVQLMKDDEYEIPFASPIEATVVRSQEADSFFDHGIKLRQQALLRTEQKPAKLEAFKELPTPRRKPRIQLFDVTLARYNQGKSGDQK